MIFKFDYFDCRKSWPRQASPGQGLRRRRPTGATESELGSLPLTSRAAVPECGGATQKSRGNGKGNGNVATIQLKRELETVDPVRS